jgi:hypothetical protein
MKLIDANKLLEFIEKHRASPNLDIVPRHIMNNILLYIKQNQFEQEDEPTISHRLDSLRYFGQLQGSWTQDNKMLHGYKFKIDEPKPDEADLYRMRLECWIETNCINNGIGKARTNAYKTFCKEKGISPGYGYES